MKIKIFLASVCFACIYSAYGNQQVKIDSTVRYSKTVIANRLDELGNVSGKNKLNKLFYCDFNALIEYLLEPSFGPAMGLRIYRRPEDTSFILETKKVTNYKDVIEQLRKKFPPKGTSIEDLYNLSQEEKQGILSYNEKIYRKWESESVNRYKINTLLVSASDSLTNRLYNKLIGLLRTAQSVEKTPGTIFDGETATFRCVVDDNELWTLQYHEPEGEYKTLSDLFRQMIADVEAGTFDEARYMGMLNN